MRSVISEPAIELIALGVVKGTAALSGGDAVPDPSTGAMPTPLANPTPWRLRQRDVYQCQRVYSCSAKSMRTACAIYG